MTSHHETILITGGTHGIGLVCVRELARVRPEARIIVANRSPLTIDLPANTTFIKLDLGDRGAARTFVAGWTFGRISAVIANAGLHPGAGAPKFTSDGIEQCFAVNHVGHSLLLLLLSNKELLEPDCRITILGSGTHDPKEPLVPSTAQWKDAESTALARTPALQDGNTRYSTSKLANIMFAKVLSRKAHGAGKRYSVVAFDPGFCPGNGSGLIQNQPALVRFVAGQIISRNLWFLRLLGMAVSTPAVAGKVLAHLAIRDTGDIQGAGEYYQSALTATGFREKPSSEVSNVESNQNDLWNWTVRAVALNATELRAFDAMQ